MTFDEVLRSSKLNLPISQKSNANFKTFLFEILDNYLELLEKLDSGSFSIPNIKSTKATLISRQVEFVNGIKKTVEYYYDGYPSKAYEELNATLNLRLTKYKGLLKINEYNIGEDFYRIRAISNNGSMNPSEFFHIPFNLRGKVATQRFSIPGFPSLYLGRTVYVCWEEMNRPDINYFQMVRLKAKAKIKYLDLSPPFLDTDLQNKQYYKYLSTWPLIAACSIRVKNNEDIFKPEYIIPQLLLQWVRSNKEIDGIRYWSTHVKKRPIDFNGELYNIVLPVKQSKEQGICDNLTDMFDITEPVSWQNHQFALGGTIFLDTDEEDGVVNAKIPELELIKGMKYPYSYSIFGKLEKYLSYMKVKPIIPTE